MADYLAGREDWDFITCELGINMHGAVTPEDFARRVDYLVSAMTRRRPCRQLALISPFLNGNDRLIPPDLAALTVRGYEAALRRIADVNAAAGVHFMHGHDLLPDVAGLTCDLIHPSSAGHAMMAERLAARLPVQVPALSAPRKRWIDSAVHPPFTHRSPTECHDLFTGDRGTARR